MRHASPHKWHHPASTLSTRLYHCKNGPCMIAQHPPPGSAQHSHHPPCRRSTRARAPLTTPRNGLRINIDQLRVEYIMKPSSAASQCSHNCTVEHWISDRRQPARLHLLSTIFRPCFLTAIKTPPSSSTHRRVIFPHRRIPQHTPPDSKTHRRNPRQSFNQHPHHPQIPPFPRNHNK